MLIASSLTGCFLFSPPDVSSGDDLDMGTDLAPDEGMKPSDLGGTEDLGTRDAGEDLAEAAADLDQGVDAGPEDLPPSPPADWRSAEHTHRIRLTPNEELALPQESLVALVKLDRQRVDFDTLAPQGKDVAFFADDGAMLSHEIEFFSKELGRADIWVEYPTSGANRSASIWMYYGEQAPQDKQDAEGLWNNYEVVHHFSRFDPNTQFPQDATANQANPYMQSNGLPFEPDGIAGLAPRFRKDDDDFIRFHKDLKLGTDFGEQRVYDLWFKVATAALLERPELAIVADEGSCRGFSAFYGDGANPLTVSGRLFYATDEASGCMSMERGAKYVTYRDTSAETWHHLTLVIDRPERTFEIWIDGTRDLPHSIITDLPQNAFTQGYELMVGNSFVPSARSFIGVIDEFRVWNGVRSEAWIKIQDSIGRDQFFVYGQPQSWK